MVMYFDKMVNGHEQIDGNMLIKPRALFLLNNRYYFHPMFCKQDTAVCQPRPRFENLISFVKLIATTLELCSPYILYSPVLNTHPAENLKKALLDLVVILCGMHALFFR